MKKYIDIGCNLSDGMYQGVYHGSTKHQPDLPAVLSRAATAGVERIIVTGTNLADSRQAIDMAASNNSLYSTVGCHPTRCGEFEAEGTTPDEYLEQLQDLLLHHAMHEQRRVVVAVGECGLDYARTNFCDIDTQKKYFSRQLSLAEVTGLPLFLHCRDAAADLVSLLAPRREAVSGGVVHSFDGSLQEMKAFLDMDLYIGINGCSLRTEENLKVAAEIPLSRLMLETDAPWCEVKATHPGYKHVTTKYDNVKKKEKWAPDCLVKGRNEPCCITQVLEVLAGVRSEDADTIAAAAYDNTCKLFFPDAPLPQ